MKKLAVYLKDYRKESILAPVFKMLEAFFDLLVPLVVAGIIDIGIAGKNKSYIFSHVGLMLLLAVVGMTSSITAQYFAAKASAGFATKIRQVMFDHVQRMSYTELDKMGTNTLITRMTSDINQVQNGYNMTLRLLLRSPFIVFGAMIMAFLIDVRCALIFAVAIPILSLVVYGIMLISIPLYKKVQASLDKVLGITRENLTGVRVIRAFCKEQEEINEFDEKNKQLTRMNEFVGGISALMNPVTYVLINLATIVLIQTGAVRVNLGRIQQGDVVALYNYMAQMIVELIKLASLIITINKSIACAERVESVLEIKSGMTYPKEMDMGQKLLKEEEDEAVRFRHVTFSYEGAGAPSLMDISFGAKKGQTVGIIGGTGSGKTSLISLIPRFYDVDEGCVEVNGRDVREYPAKWLTDRIGVVPQKAMLFSGSIRDNLKWGKEQAEDTELMEAATIAQAKEVILGKPEKLDFMLEQNGRNLSGGQRQRLTIARALVKRPDILILDDSASALDFTTDAALRKAIQGMRGKMTVFLISQRASSIRYADIILVMEDGQLAGQGTHEELMRSCRTYQEIYYSQYPDERPPETDRPEEGKARQREANGMPEKGGQV